MNKKNRIYLYGPRLSQFAIRVIILNGMLSLYSLVTGAALDNAAQFLFGLIILIGLSVLLVILWFRSRKQCELDRSHQLAAEIAILYPSASPDEKKKLYALRRSREMRKTALLYLFLVVLVAVWFWGLYAADVSPVSWTFGPWIVLAGLLFPAVLLLLSFIPRRKEESVPDASAQEIWAARIALNRRKVPTENGERVAPLVFLEKEALTAEEYLRRERKDALSNLIVTGFIRFFFFALPLVLLGLDIYMVIIGKVPKWSVLMFGMIAFSSISLWAFARRIQTRNESFFAVLITYIRFLNGNTSAVRDSIQSYGEDESTPYIVFSRNGTVRLLLEPELFHRYFAVPKQAVLILMYKDRIESVSLLPCDDESIPAAVSFGDTPEDDILLSDWALHQAVLRTIEQMPPSRKKEMELWIESMLDYTEPVRKKALEMTSEELGRLNYWFINDMEKSSADRDLEAVESAVMNTLKVTRHDIMYMKKNPLVPSLRRKLLTAAVIGTGGIVGTAAVEKWTGLDLGFVYLVFSGISGALALSCANHIITTIRFRKLQKAYKNPEYRQKVLDAAVYREIKEQVKLRRQRR